MGIVFFRSVGSQTATLMRIAKSRYHQFQAEGVADKDLVPLQDIINDLEELNQYLHGKWNVSPDIVDVLENYPPSKAEWIRLLNELYEVFSILIRKYEITNNESINRTMSLLEEQQTGRFVTEEFSKDRFINMLIYGIQEDWSDDKNTPFAKGARHDLVKLLEYIKYLQETSQQQEADHLIERLAELDLGYVPLSLLHAQMLIRRGEQSAAKEVLNQILKEQPENEEALALKVQVSE